MRFLVDAQRPRALARCSPIADTWRSTSTTSDYTPPTIESFGTAGCLRERSSSKDEDSALRRTLVDAGPAIVWLRRGNTSRRYLLAWFEPLLPTVIDLLSRGEPLAEIA